jgi:DNA-directed RNA polymerase subunit M/transcription elongation factor TFIIS
MSACPNCGNQLSCGCQRRTASNGVTVCSSCLSSYEATLQTNTQKNEKPELQAWGKDRYKNLSKFIKT